MARRCTTGRHALGCECRRASGLPRLAPLSVAEEIAAEERLAESIAAVCVLARELGTERAASAIEGRRGAFTPAALTLLSDAPDDEAQGPQLGLF